MYELIDVVKFHFPIYVQYFAAIQLTCFQYALDLLKRLEGIEMREGQLWLNSDDTSQNQGHTRIGMTTAVGDQPMVMVMDRNKASGTV